jgi:hypothetical protein
MAKHPMQLIDPPSPFAPMKDLQAFLQEFEAKQDRTPAEEEALQEVRESIAHYQAQDQANRREVKPA